MNTAVKIYHTYTKPDGLLDCITVAVLLGIAGYMIQNYNSSLWLLVPGGIVGLITLIMRW